MISSKENRLAKILRDKINEYFMLPRYREIDIIIVNNENEAHNLVDVNIEDYKTDDGKKRKIILKID